jgi:hypothetical protein
MTVMILRSCLSGASRSDEPGIHDGASRETTCTIDPVVGSEFAPVGAPRNDKGE